MTVKTVAAISNSAREFFEPSIDRFLEEGTFDAVLRVPIQCNNDDHRPASPLRQILGCYKAVTRSALLQVTEPAYNETWRVGPFSGTRSNAMRRYQRSKIFALTMLLVLTVGARHA